jgi:hypothetical protein
VETYLRLAQSLFESLFQEDLDLPKGSTQQTGGAASCGRWSKVERLAPGAPPCSLSPVFGGSWGRGRGNATIRQQFMCLQRQFNVVQRPFVGGARNTSRSPAWRRGRLAEGWRSASCPRTAEGGLPAGRGPG